jgi:hypothetical protein
MTWRNCLLPRHILYFPDDSFSSLAGVLGVDAEGTGLGELDMALSNGLTTVEPRRGDDEPVVFRGHAFDTSRIPLDWYLANTEPQLVELMKCVLARSDTETAAAMVLEIFNYPRDWIDITGEERAYNEDFGTPWPIDSEFISLVRQAFPGVSLADNAGYWDCYRAILWGAHPS